MHVLAPAKINLCLRVGPPRDDGFHPLLSWMCTIGLFDTLTFQLSDGPGFSLESDQADLPVDRGNLVVRAATLLSAGMRRQANLGASASLAKRIPIGSGLGGGSSDAARTLLALDRLWQLECPKEQLVAMAAQLGSDVPFFLFEPSAICTGRGEIVRPCPPPSARWALLLLPSRAMPTPAVYRQFDQMGLGKHGNLANEPVWDKWASLPAADLLEVLVNDLEPAAFTIAPDLGELRAEAQRMLLRPVRMSGSGSSLFTLFDERTEAQRAAHLLTSALQVRCCAVQAAPQLVDGLNERSGSV